MTKVMVFGSFDLVHPGHLYFLKKAKRFGDQLIVVIGRDSTIEKVKGKKPKYDEKQRKEHVTNINYVDKAVLGYEKDHYEIIEEINPDIICLGYDQTSFSNNLEEELKKRGLKAKIKRLDAYKEHIYKSSKLK